MSDELVDRMMGAAEGLAEATRRQCLAEVRRFRAETEVMEATQRCDEARDWRDLSLVIVAVLAVTLLAILLLPGFAHAAEPEHAAPVWVRTSTCAGWCEAWATERASRVRWEGIAEQRKVRIAELAGNLDDQRAQAQRLARALAATPPPAAHDGAARTRWSVFLDLALPAGGAALGGAVGALACSPEGLGCPTGRLVLVGALGAALGALAGAVVAP